MSYVNQALAFLQQYPALLAIILGTFASWTAATLLEQVFLPTHWSPRELKQATVMANLVFGTAISAITWHFLAPKDPRGFRIAVSFTCALISPFSYVWVARVLSHYIPWFQSAWQLSPPQEPKP